MFGGSKPYTSYISIYLSQYKNCLKDVKSDFKIMENPYPLVV
jgi:hypothetical protein